MRITIAERLRPFSHRPGTYCLLPGSPYRLQIFPALIRIHDLSRPQPGLVEEIDLAVEGPVNTFTLTQDLEKGVVRIEGQTQTGFMRYLCGTTSDRNRILLQMEKTPPGGIFCNCLNKFLQPKDIMIVDHTIYLASEASFYSPPETPRLSFGNHKAQDWEYILRRLSMEEIFPLWARLGELTPSIVASAKEGTLHLLEECRTAIDSRRPETIVPAFRKMMLAGFEGILSPRLDDPLHQGIALPKLSSKFSGSPLALLSEAAQLIRSLFFKEEGSEVSILPSLPPEFHCGRFLGLQYQGVGSVDLEWSKKTIRRMVLHAKVEGEAFFHFQTSLKSFRLRQGKLDRGKRIKMEPFRVSPDVDYFLDNFQR